MLCRTLIAGAVLIALAFPAFAKNPDGSTAVGTVLSGFGQSYRSDFTAYSTELEQIWQVPRHTAVFGGRSTTSPMPDTCAKRCERPALRRSTSNTGGSAIPAADGPERLRTSARPTALFGRNIPDSIWTSTGWS